MIPVRATQARDKENRERYNGYSAVRYASERRMKAFHPQAEPKMQ